MQIYINPLRGRGKKRWVDLLMAAINNLARESAFCIRYPTSIILGYISYYFISLNIIITLNNSFWGTVAHLPKGKLSNQIHSVLLTAVPLVIAVQRVNSLRAKFIFFSISEKMIQMMKDYWGRLTILVVTFFLPQLHFPLESHNHFHEYFLLKFLLEKGFVPCVTQVKYSGVRKKLLRRDCICIVSHSQYGLRQLIACSTNNIFYSIFPEHFLKMFQPLNHLVIGLQNLLYYQNSDSSNCWTPVLNHLWVASTDTGISPLLTLCQKPLGICCCCYYCCKRCDYTIY